MGKEVAITKNEQPQETDRSRERERGKWRLQKATVNIEKRVDHLRLFVGKGDIDDLQLINADNIIFCFFDALSCPMFQYCQLQINLFFLHISFSFFSSVAILFKHINFHVNKFILFTAKAYMKRINNYQTLHLYQIKDYIRHLIFIYLKYLACFLQYYKKLCKQINYTHLQIE